MLDSQMFGYFVVLGMYFVELVCQYNGEIIIMGECQIIEVECLIEGVFLGFLDDEVVVFWECLVEMQCQLLAVNVLIGQIQICLVVLQFVLYCLCMVLGDLDVQLEVMCQELFEIEEVLGGNQSCNGWYGVELLIVGLCFGFV